MPGDSLVSAKIHASLELLYFASFPPVLVKKRRVLIPPCGGQFMER